MNKTLKAVGVVGALGVAGLLLSPVVADASSVPKSPDGIYSSNLCGVTSFSVDDGTYLHDFYPDGPANYVNGGIQYHWSEYVWWGLIQVSGYTFTVTCGE